MSENQKKIYFNIFCIDKRFDELASTYFNDTGFKLNYYTGTIAGSSLCLGYSDMCNYVCTSTCQECIEPSCDPYNPSMKLLKDSIIENINISLTLDNIEEIYLLNHQDCGAMKGFISCSGYPQTLGENNQLEIDINVDVLTYAAKYLRTIYPNIKIRLGLMDVNGAVCDYIEEYRTWILKYRGPGVNPDGLWFGFDTVI